MSTEVYIPGPSAYFPNILGASCSTKSLDMQRNQRPDRANRHDTGVEERTKYGTTGRRETTSRDCARRCNSLNPVSALARLPLEFLSVRRRSQIPQSLAQDRRVVHRHIGASILTTDES